MTTRTVSFPSLLPLGAPLTLQIQGAPTHTLAVRAALEHFARERVLLQSLDFSNLDLQEANLDGLMADYCSFHSCNLSGATMRGATLQNCDLQKIATSPSTKLTGSTLFVCNFDGAYLVSVQAGQTNWNGSRFKNAHAAGLIAPESSFRNCRTFGADFRGAVLHWSDISNTEGKASIARESAGTEIDREILRLFNDRNCIPEARPDLEKMAADAGATLSSY